MPAVLIPVISAIGAAAGGVFGATLIMGAVQIGTILGYGLLIGGAYAMSERAKRKARAQYNASQVDRLVNLGSTVMPRELVLGRVRKGGSIIFRGSVGTYKERFVMVLALAGHECDGIETVYLNDTPVSLDTGGYVVNAPYSRSTTVKRVKSIPAGQTTIALEPLYIANTATAYITTYDFMIEVVGAGEFQTPVPFTVSGTTLTLAAPSTSTVTVSYDVLLAEDSKANIRFYLGQPGQQADARLMQLFPGVWTANHKLTGITYAICEFGYDETAFPSGVPTLTVVMRGAKCFDPRNSTTAWTRNPSLHMRHVLTHPNFGQRATLTAEETARIQFAANACDLPHTWLASAPASGAWGTFESFVQIALLNANAVGTQPLYTSDIVVPYGTTAADVFDDLAQAMAGFWGFSMGELYVKPGVYTPSVKNFTIDDLANEFTTSEGGVTQQAVNITTHKAKVDKINVVKPTIWDAAQEYKSVPLNAVRVESFVVKDKGVLATEVQMTAVSSSLRAAHIANVMLRDARDSLTVTVTLKLSAYVIELFDVVSFTLPRYGWDAKPFLVLGRAWTPEGLIQLSLKETHPEVYDADAEFAVSGFAPNTNLPNPWFLPTPVISSITSGTPELTRNPDGSIIANIRVRWEPPADFSLSTGTGQVEVRYGTYNQLGEVTSTVPADFKWQTVSAAANDLSVRIPSVNEGITYAIQTRARNTLTASEWSSTYSHVVIGKTAKPSNVSACSITLSEGRAVLTVTPIPDLDVDGYEVRSTDANWGTAGAIFRGSVTTIPVYPYQLGLNTWFVRAYDTSKNYSNASFAVTYTLAQLPEVSGVSSFFTDTSLTAATVTLSWVDSAPALGLAGYEITYLAEVVTVKANTVTLPANWVGNRTFTIKTVDTAGFKSSGTSAVVEKKAPDPATNFRAQVIDNTVLLYWTLPAKTSLPISHALLRKGGTSWANATNIGTKDGEFTTLTELAGGDYTYRLAVVDTDGVESSSVSLSTKVSQPPDFIFNGEFDSTFTGTKSNSVKEPTTGYLYLPVNSTETFAQHFTNNSWTTPQAQISAGYPYYPQPGSATGYYEEVFDFGTILASSNASVNLTGSDLVGSTTLAVTISLSANNVTYTDYPGLTAVFGSNFRYVKVRVSATQATAGAIYELRRLNVRLDAKLKSDAGSTSVTTDVNGTLFNFNSEFVEVVSINPSANGATLLTPVADFYDVIQSGTYSVTSGVCTVTITAHKAVVGSRVRIAPSTGLLPVGVYTVATVPTANTLTFSTASANTSGSVLLYHNFGKLHLFDSSGTRVAGTVSWSIRGF